MAFGIWLLIRIHKLISAVPGSFSKDSGILTVPPESTPTESKEITHKVQIKYRTDDFYLV